MSSHILSLSFIPTLILLLTLQCLADQAPFIRNSAYNAGKLGKYPTQTFLSNPKVTEVPLVNFERPFTNCDVGSFLFVAPRGVVAKSTPMILDVGISGSPVWASTKGYGQVYNLQVQQYKGKPYLTFWGGNDAVGGHGIGQYYMLDQQYKQQFEIQAANGLGADLHAFTITEDDTALISIYDKAYLDISSVTGTPTNGWIWDSIFQELDLETGEALFEWRASRHIDVNKSYTDVNEATELDPWDVYHINSVEKDATGNYLISIRFLRALLYIDGRSGDVLWQLGGKDNSFSDLSDGAATTFLGQHDAHFQEGNKFVTLFDNRADWYHQIDDQSKGTRVELNLETMEARLDTIFVVSDTKILSTSQGSLQTLPNGHVLMGYGYNGVIAEFSPEGELLCSAYLQPSSTFGSGDVQSYRNLKFNWTAMPDTDPDLAFAEKNLYMSWNGATEVDAWLLLGSDTDLQEEVPKEALEVRGVDDAVLVGKTGFETEYQLDVRDGLGRFIRVVALDREGRPLGASNVVDVGVEFSVSEHKSGKESTENENDRETLGADEDGDSNIDYEVDDLPVLLGFGLMALVSGIVILLMNAGRRGEHRPWWSESRAQDAEKAEGATESDGQAVPVWRRFWTSIRRVVSRKHGYTEVAAEEEECWSPNGGIPDLSQGLVAQAR